MYVRYTTVLESIAANLTLTGKVAKGKVHLFTSTAIFNKDESNVDFFFDTPEGDAGSTLMKDSNSISHPKKQFTAPLPVIQIRFYVTDLTNTRERNSPFVFDRALDIVTLFRKVLKVRLEDKVVLKIDIEGFEFELLRRMAFHGLLQFVDDLAIEWHDTNSRVFGKLPEYKVFHSCLNWVMKEEPTLNLIPWK